MSLPQIGKPPYESHLEFEILNGQMFKMIESVQKFLVIKFEQTIICGPNCIWAKLEILKVLSSLELIQISTSCFNLIAGTISTHLRTK